MNNNDLEKMAHTLSNINVLYEDAKKFKDVDLDRINLSKIGKIIKKNKMKLSLYLFTICAKYFGISILFTLVLIEPFIINGYVENAIMLGSGFMGIMAAIFIIEINRIKSYDNKNRSIMFCFNYEIRRLMSKKRWSFIDKFKVCVLYNGTKKLNEYYLDNCDLLTDKYNFAAMKNINYILEHDVNDQFIKELETYSKAFDTNMIDYSIVSAMTRKCVSNLTLKRIFVDNSLKLVDIDNPKIQQINSIGVGLFIYNNYFIKSDGMPYFNKTVTKDDLKNYLESTNDITLFTKIMIISAALYRAKYHESD